MIKGFNGIRGIAVLMVLVTHFKLSNYLLYEIDITSIYHGTTGVYIFFCLSGFLITYILIKEFEKTKTLNIKNFLIRRALRLLPVMIAYCLVLLLLMSFGYIETNIPSLIYAITYTTNFSLRKHYSPLLYHFWSLSVEEHFYLFYPLFFKLKSKIKILIILGVLIIISLIVKVLQVNYILYVKQLTDNYRWTIPAILPILTGAFMALSITYPKVKQFIENNKFLLLAMGFILFSSEVLIHTIYFKKLGLNYLFQSIGIAFILTFVFIHQKSIIVKILEFPPLTFIGKISYGLYIWHMLFSDLVVKNIISLPIGVISSFFVSILSYYTIERYFLQKKDKFKYSVNGSKY